MHLSKFAEAIVQFKMLLEFAAYRFEIYDGLVTCYINTQRLREAHLLATDAVRLLGKTSRTYVVKHLLNCVFATFTLISDFHSI